MDNKRRLMLMGIPAMAISCFGDLGKLEKFELQKAKKSLTKGIREGLSQEQGLDTKKVEIFINEELDGTYTITVELDSDNTPRLLAQATIHGNKWNYNQTLNLLLRDAKEALSHQHPPQQKWSPPQPGDPTAL